MQVLTRRWAIRQCREFFKLTDADERSIQSNEGRKLLLSLWEADPATFYEHPLQLLRQEWFHAARSDAYWHGGFWAAVKPWGIILDYGCGTGEVARLPWIARGGRIDLVEPSTICGDYLRYKFADYDAVRIVAEGARFHPGYDALICTDVLEHVPNPLEVQQELWDLLKPGGHALLKFESVFPHPGHLQESIAQIPQWWAWLQAHAELIEVETYCWCRKPV